MTIDEIKAKLDAAGVEYTERGSRLYVDKTPNGKRAQYGYLVEAGDVRDICEHIVKRNGEIASILRA